MVIIILDYSASIKNGDADLKLLVRKDAYGILTNEQDILQNF